MSDFGGVVAVFFFWKHIGEEVEVFVGETPV